MTKATYLIQELQQYRSYEFPYFEEQLYWWLDDGKKHRKSSVVSYNGNDIMVLLGVWIGTAATGWMVTPNNLLEKLETLKEIE